MLVAPLFHNSYLSPKESQRKKSDGTSTSSGKIGEASSSSKYNNIFKTALNRGISFLSKITNSSGSNTPTSSKAPESEENQDSSTPSDCSSPDSLKTELVFFKPISREPKTPSAAKPILLRVPSIRSTASSTDRHISSPCPSPFFIPITNRRESAFSFVNATEENTAVNKTPLIIKPKATKRKNVKTSPLKPPKRLKLLNEKKSVVTAKQVREKPKGNRKTEIVAVVTARKTRSMDKKNEVALTQAKIVISKAKKPSPRKDSSTEPRVTRSRSLKH